MKHSTNYFNTLIEIAEDCPAINGMEPPQSATNQSIANLQFEMLKENPYRYTSDEILFTVFAHRKEYDKSEWEEQRNLYFSKGQPCFRASPLTKRYGWGIHSNAEGKIALYSAASEAYQALLHDDDVKKVKAMRSKRK